VSQATPAQTPGAGQPAAVSEVSESFWTSLRFFNFYRILIAASLLLAVVIYGDLLNLGSFAPRAFAYTAVAYFVLAVLYQAVIRQWPWYFNTQLSVHVLTDVAALTMLMWASGGIRSGIGVMLLVSLAAAALVSGGSLMLFYAAVASIALLLEQTYWVLAQDASTAGYLQPGLLSIGYFATALITNQLAQRVIRNERVARQRGADLAIQLRVNQLVIRDVQDGVLVVDSNGLVRQQNPAAAALLGAAPELDQIENYSSELAGRLAHWRDGAGDARCEILFPGSGRRVRARFIRAGVDGGSFSLVYLEDLSRREAEAQQLKLAALGRLTASIAHEIRNPLSSITHAGDLLLEEADEASRRLVTIIHDNAHRLDKMVKDVLELSRRDRVQRQRIALAPYLAEFVEEFSRVEGIPSGAIAFEPGAAREGGVDFDPVHLRQVVWNLLRNAWRHGHKLPGSVRIALRGRADRLELHVIDDGGGVPKALQAQLFEPFFTTFSRGTGLGLYIARELCAANAALLDYLDGPSGADFRIRFSPSGLRATAG
jgi:two-component system sensor histidine kinase PilS (NtrC family)